MQKATTHPQPRGAFDGAAVRAERRNQGLTTSEFAAAVGVSGKMVARYETRKNEPGFGTAARIALVLGLPLESLYVHEDDAIGPAGSTPLNDPEPTAALPRPSAVGSR